MGTGDSLDGLLHGGAHWSSRGTDVGCHPVAVDMDGGLTRCVRTRRSSWWRRRARRTAGSGWRH
jgi:hypothetical protein